MIKLFEDYTTRNKEYLNLLKKIKDFLDEVLEKDASDKNYRTFVKSMWGSYTIKILFNSRYNHVSLYKIEIDNINNKVKLNSNYVTDVSMFSEISKYMEYKFSIFNRIDKKNKIIDDIDKLSNMQFDYKEYKRLNTMKKFGL